VGGGEFAGYPQKGTDSNPIRGLQTDYGPTQEERKLKKDSDSCVRAESGGGRTIAKKGGDIFVSSVKQPM